MVKDSFKQLGDGSATVILSCPVISCNEPFKVSYKSYNSCYQLKKKLAVNQRPIPPRWYLFPVQNHIKKLHHPPSSSNSLPLQTEETLADERFESSILSAEAAVDFTNESSSTTSDENRVNNAQNHSVPVSQTESVTQRLRRKRTFPGQKTFSTKRTKM